MDPLTKAAAAFARGQRGRGRPKLDHGRTAAREFSIAEQLEEAERIIEAQRATIAKLHQAVAAAERRARAAEESARRAYAGFAAAGARR